MATCSSADSVLEAASQIKSNATKLNTFVNGTASQTVQLGTGDPTPTLRNLAAHAIDEVAEAMGESITEVTAAVSALQSGKADKVSGAIGGNLAALNVGGNLIDAGIARSNVATKDGDIAGLQSGKADKVSGATSGHFAGLNSSGNITDSGKGPSDITALENGKANKVSGATAGDIAVLDASGDLVDSGVKPEDKADKVEDAVAGDFAGLDAEGNLTDSGRSPDDITALEEAVESLEERKADKVVDAVPRNLARLDASGNLRDAGHAAEDFTPLLDYANGEALELEWQVRTSMNVQAVDAKADDLDVGKADKVQSAESGNLAKLDADGNIRDAGHAVEDFTPLLAYANGEAIELAWQNSMNITSCYNWYKRGMENLEGAYLVSMQTTQNIRDLIDAFDESYAQHRLQIRLFDGTNPTSSSKPLVFVVAGQSNAIGSGEYQPFDSARDCGWFWGYDADNGWGLWPLNDDKMFRADRGSSWCAFARRFFALTGRKVIIFNIASSGSAVTDGGYTTTNTWADNGYGTLRANAENQWTNFKDRNAADSYELGAVLWVQGESDAGRIQTGTVTAAQYKDATLDVFNWMHGESMFDDASLPIFIGQTGGAFPTFLEDSSYRAACESVQKVQSELYDYETIFPGFSMVKYFALAPEAYYEISIHYNALGYKLQGDSFARSCVSYTNI